MPFTPTHIVAVLPVAGMLRYLPFSALAIGSMIPDVPVFAPFVVPYALTHSPYGVFTTCLPLGLAAYLLFQCVLKTPAISLFPCWMQARMMPYSTSLLRPSVGFLLCVSIAITVGAYTHIAWDAFTHQGRWGTQWFPILNKTVAIAGYKITGYKIFQYGSTLAGLPLLTLLGAVRLSRTTPAPISGLHPFSPQAKLCAVAAVVAILLLVTCVVFITSKEGVYVLVGRTIKNSGLFLMVAFVLYCISFQIATKGKYGM